MFWFLKVWKGLYNYKIKKPSMAPDHYYVYENKKETNDIIFFRGLQYKQEWHVVKFWKKIHCYNYDCKKIIEQSQIVYQGFPKKVNGSLVVEKKVMEYFFGMKEAIFLL
jgi:hypothetical protein